VLAPLLLSFAVIFVAGWSQNYVKPDKHLQECQEDVDVRHRLLGVHGAVCRSCRGLILRSWCCPAWTDTRNLQRPSRLRFG
jgi:hypothetical protein